MLHVGQSRGEKEIGLGRLSDDQITFLDKLPAHNRTSQASIETSSLRA